MLFIKILLLETSDSDEAHRNRTVSKHGACVIHYNKLVNEKVSEANQITTAEKYMSTATELAITYNMGQYLRGHFLKKTHPVRELVTTIKKRLGVTPQIHFLVHENVPYLDQIYLYFDKEFNLIDSHHANVDTQVMYLGCRGNMNASALPTKLDVNHEFPVDNETLPAVASSEESTEPSASSHKH